MNTRRLLAVLLVVCALVIGSSPRAQEQKPTMEGYPALGAQPIVTLVTPGSAPRTRLRYAIAANHKSGMEMTMSMSMNMNMGGVPVPITVPPITMPVNLVVTSVAPNGDVTYDLEFQAVKAEGAAGDPMAAAMQAAASGITGLKGTVTVNDRGATKAAKLALDSVTDPQTRQILGQMTSSIQNMSMPLPEEAVGAGARWEVRQTISNDGPVIFQKTEVELVSVSGPTVTLKIKTEQTAPPQAISNPALPEGASMSVEKLSGSGTGSVVIRLDSLVPTSELDTTTSTSMAMNMGGQSQSVTVDGTMKLTIKRSN